MTKKIALIVCSVLAFVCANAHNAVVDSTQAVVRESIRFGYVSYNEILQAMPEYAMAKADMDTIRTTYEKEVRVSEAELNRRFAEYVEGQKTFPENILLKRQKEIQMLIEQGAQFREEVRVLLAKAEEDLMQQVYNKLNDALLKVGKDRGYAFILNTDNNSCPFVNPDMGEDATDAVLTVLGIE